MTIHMSQFASDLDAANSASTSAHRVRGFYRDYAKRFVDVLLVLIGAPIVLTVVAAMALMVFLEDGRAPFYSQARVGKNGRSFRLWKIRTMVPNADSALQAHLQKDGAARAEWLRDQKLRNDPRITRVGAVLRKTSLDELPQLWNVLMGDMSLVGPRPMMVNQREHYSGVSYMQLRPGVTGPWQISDRNACSFAGRVRFDDAYDRDLSFGHDVRILLQTVATVLRGTGC